MPAATPAAATAVRVETSSTVRRGQAEALLTRLAVLRVALGNQRTA